MSETPTKKLSKAEVAQLVLDFPKSRVNASLVENFMKTTTSKEETEKKEMLLIALKLQRNKGFGRPTKRDRRDLKDWY